MDRKNNTIEDFIFKLKIVKAKTKSKFYRIVSEYYYQMNCLRQRTIFEEDVFSKNAQVIVKIMHEALLLMKTLQPKTQIRIKNKNLFDWYYTIKKNLSDEGGEN